MAGTFLEPAFHDAVQESQRTFRAALKAMSEPGLIQSLGNAPALGILQPATYALCLTLFDGDTPVWLAPAFDTPQVRANLAFHCACPIVDEREQAAFSVIGEEELNDLAAFDQGSDRDPDRSCTLVAQLQHLERGAPTRWQGPGIAAERIVRLPVPDGYWQQRKAAHAFPRGLDVFFTAGRMLVGLPRSTRVLHSMQEVL